MQYGYDGDQLTSIVQEDGNGVVLCSFSYSYNEAGQLISQTANAVTTNYAYDAAGQLTQAGSQSYAYDANGNRTGPGIVIGPDNELLSDGTWDYTYDGAGNLIKKVNIAEGTTWTYSYDAMNEQTGAIETDVNATVLQQETNVFDVFGNRIEMTAETYSGSSMTTTQQKYVYTMGGTLYADLEGNGTVQSRYVSDVNGPNHWLAQVDAGGGGAWLLSDYEGSVCTLVSLDATTVLDRIVYDAFGNITSDADPSDGGRIKFQGGEYDSLTATYLFGQRGRIYNPETGTWNRPDPDGLCGWAKQSV